MQKHTVSVNDVEFPIVLEQQLCGSFGGVTTKSLVCQTVIPDECTTLLDSRFVVRIDEKHESAQVFEFNRLEDAVVCYNEYP